MSHENSLTLLFALCVLTCSHLVGSENVTATDDPTKTSTESDSDGLNTTMSVGDISSSTASSPLSTIITPSTMTTVDTEATTTTTTASEATTLNSHSTTTITTTPTATTAPSTLSSTDTSDMTTTTAVTSEPTTTALGSATLCPSVEESFFGRYGLIVFIVAIGIILLLLYTILMLLLLPRILNKPRKGGKYTVTKGGRKSKDHQGIPPLAIGVDEDTQSTSKVIDHGPLMLVTAMDSVALTSEQDDDGDGDDGDGQSNGPLNPSKDDTRKSSSDQGNVSTFLLRQTSIRQAEERRRAEAEAQHSSGSQEMEDSASTNLVTTGNVSPLDGNVNVFESHVTPVFASPSYGVNNDITEV